MKILVVCQHYYPEPFRITDICEELVRIGHEVTVVTGLPNYPQGKIYEGYKGKVGTDEIINGVKVHRCFEIGRRNGPIFRILNYYSFAWSSKRYIKKMKDNFDVIFANQLSPIMMVDGAVAYKRKHGTKLVLYCLDLWPESLVVGGIKRGSFVYKYFHKVSKKIYCQADKILISSKGFKNYLTAEFDIQEEKISYLPQYAESLFSVENCKKHEDGQVNLVFAGNIGVAQSVDTIIRAADKTQDIENLHWHIVGDGSDLEHVRNLAQELNVKSVEFHGRKALEEMPVYYGMADAMLVTLVEDEILSLTLPGKVQTYMATGKPIIAAANGEIAAILDEVGCGYCGKAEDSEMLEANVRRFCENLRNGKAQEFGDNARAFYEENFEKSVFFETLEKMLEA